jgi:hypothetical protein
LLLAGSKTAQAAAAKGDVWLTYPLNPGPDQRWLSWAWIALALVGVVVQMRTGTASGGSRPRLRAARKR